MTQSHGLKIKSGNHEDMRTYLMKEMNGIEKERDAMFGMSSTQDHSERFGGKEGHKIREREEKDIATNISYSYRRDLEVVIILIAILIMIII